MDSVRSNLVSSNASKAILCVQFIVFLKRLGWILRNPFLYRNDKSKEVFAAKTDKEKRLRVDRGAYLVCKSAYWRLDETWISTQPVLFLLHLAQFLPSVSSYIINKVGPKRGKAAMDRSSSMYSCVKMMS